MNAHSLGVRLLALCCFASHNAAAAAAAPRAAMPPAAPSAAQDQARKESPFDGLRWVGEAPEVQIGDDWYRPVSIAGVPVAEILEFCDRRWPSERQKRFGEDLVEALTLMGHAPPQRSQLELVSLATGRAVILDDVAWTRAKRSAIRDAGRRAPAPAPPARLVPRAEALRDLDQFRALLVDRFAYLGPGAGRPGAGRPEMGQPGIGHLGTEQIDARLADLRSELSDEVDVAELAGALRTILLLSGDGHADVRSPYGPSVERFAPFLLEEVDGGVVAVRTDRSDFVEPARPFVHAIDGRPLSEWLEALRPTVAAGSPQLVRLRSLRGLRELDLARRLLGLEERASTTLTLSARPKGGPTRARTLQLSPRRPIYGAWPERKSERLKSGAAARIAGGVGYLRIAEMDDGLVPELRAQMEAFRGTGGLVVDVRGNGGGKRGLLLALAGYLIAPDLGPVVVNVAAYRMSDAFPRDHLGGSRHLFRANDRRWTAPQRAAIEAVAARFKPEWPLPEGFSEWHYLVLDRAGVEGEYHYSKPVVVLSDAACFSATDIFLASLAELPNVSIVGLPSSGGSARAMSFELPHTRIEVTCASMASFRVDGRLFDGRGIEVDHLVERAPRDVLVGGGDAQLEAALRLLARD